MTFGTGIRMPVRRGRDAAGCYYQWGGMGKRYYYTPGSYRSRARAQARAARQGRAIEARRHRPA
jgi:hypothetical protein